VHTLGRQTKQEANWYELGGGEWSTLVANWFEQGGENDGARRRERRCQVEKRSRLDDKDYSRLDCEGSW
jgi:hypothetical protein